VKRWLHLAAAALGACSGQDPPANDCSCPPQPDAGAESAADAQQQDTASFCAETFGRHAAAYDSCCTAGDKLTPLYKAAYGTWAAVAWECGDKLARSVAQGRATLVEEAASSCVQQVGALHDQAGCAVLHAGIDWEATSCRGAVLGLQAEGQPCRYRYECMGGLTCVGYSDGLDGACQGVSPGGACRMEEVSGAADDIFDALFGQHPVCADGYSCQHTAQYGVCAKRAGPGSYCVVDGDCEPGLRCQLGACGTSAPSQQGGDCNVSQDCAPGLYCHPQSQAGAWGTCESTKAAGQPCSAYPSDACLGYCGPGVCVEICGSG
jgi:hypothetical protein